MCQVQRPQVILYTIIAHIIQLMHFLQTQLSIKPNLDLEQTKYLLPYLIHVNFIDYASLLFLC